MARSKKGRSDPPGFRCQFKGLFCPPVPCFSIWLLAFWKIPGDNFARELIPSPRPARWGRQSPRPGHSQEHSALRLSRLLSGKGVSWGAGKQRDPWRSPGCRETSSWPGLAPPTPGCEAAPRAGAGSARFSPPRLPRAPVPPRADVQDRGAAVAAGTRGRAEGGPSVAPRRLRAADRGQGRRGASWTAWAHGQPGRHGGLWCAADAALQVHSRRGRMHVSLARWQSRRAGLRLAAPRRGHEDAPRAEPCCAGALPAGPDWCGERRGGGFGIRNRRAVLTGVRH